ncbi:MAG: glutathione S-transferase N-terminal domain-containing protein [Oligoflexales bacterium]
MKKIQLYSLATPNGQKVSIALEEMELEYEAHTVDITKNEQFTKSFIQMNPNSKIPVIVDPSGPKGQSITLMESGAILLYLAEKTGLFLSEDPIQKSETIQWLFFQMGSVGPMFGQFGHFYKYATQKCDHPYPVERYTNEVVRILGVLDKRLSQSSYIVESVSIADFAIAPWVICLDDFYQASTTLNLDGFYHVQKWMDKMMNRSNFQKGLGVCSFE